MRGFRIEPGEVDVVLGGHPAVGRLAEHLNRGSSRQTGGQGARERTIAELCSAMRLRGIRLEVAGDQLRFDAPTGALSAELREEMRRRKPEILEYLRNSSDPMGLPQGPIHRVPRDGRLPLSLAQARLWFMAQLVPASAFYNVPATLRLEGELDQTALHWSLQQLVLRHETLRATFHEENGEPYQRIAGAQPVDMPVTDLTDVPDAARDTEARRLAAAEAQKLFDLSRGPLLRTRLLRLDDQDHILTLTMHHIISDGWSMGILVRELAEFYRAFRHGQPPSLPELTIQYVDFANWQRQWLQGDALASLLGYWARKLADLPTLELPTDRARPKVQTFRGTRQWMTLSPALSDALREFSRHERVTLFMTMMAAFKVLLYRYSGQTDMVVGSPIANRNQVEVEGLVGFFVSTLVIRTDLEGGPTFRELLGRVRDVALEAYSHQEVPFEKLVEQLETDRDLSRHPLFQVVFALQNAPMPPVELDELRLTLGWADTLATRCDLEAHVWDEPEGLRVAFVYSTDLFDSSTIERMIRHFQTLLESAVTHPDQPISRLSIMGQHERRQLLDEWNDTTTAYPRDRCIHELFEAQAARTPDATAVVFEAEQLTYRQLNARANRLARHLRQLGVGPEVTVGLCVRRSLEMVVGVLGILKAGGAYVPLDPGYPDSRLQFMVADTRSPVLLTQGPLVPQLSWYRGRMLRLDRDWPDIARERATSVEAGTRPDNLACVMYTSGSTGRPKGTSVVHRGVVRLVKNTNYAAFGPHDVFLQLAPISFDASTFELWGSLLNGSKLVIFPPHPPSLDELGESVQANGVTTLWLTAALFHRMVDEHLECLRGVRQLLAGGDVLSVAHVEKAIAHLGDRRLINGYGPTENTTFSCCHVMTSASRVGRSVPIGRPVSNTQVYILDQEMQPVPVGVPGQLYLGGDGLAREYLNQPALTGKRFVANPFSVDVADRLYRTGDRARYLADGAIEFLGRMDHQVKIRGFRIEPAEIEAWLARHPLVKESVVTAREDDAGDRRLVAYVVARGTRPPSVSQLRRFLGHELPDHMVPNTYVFLDSLPISPNGKLDRQRLPDPAGQRPDVEAAFVRPRTELERTIADLWREVLGVDAVGLHDNFFDIGGHSLLLLVVRGRLMEATKQELSMIEMFKYPTVAGLAQRLNRGSGNATSGPGGNEWPGPAGGSTRLAQLEKLRQQRGKA